MYNQLIFAYIIFFVFGAALQYRLWKREKLSALFLFHGSFLLYYVFIPIVLFLFEDYFRQNIRRFTFYILSYEPQDYILVLLTTLLSYSFLLVCILVRKVYRTHHKNHYSGVIDENETYFQDTIVFRYGIFFLIIGGGSVIGFFYQMGGIQSAMASADLLRDASTDPTQYYGPLAGLFRMLSFLSMGAAYCFKVYYDNKKNKRGILLFTISFILSLFYLVFNSGRATIIFFLVPFVMEYTMRKGKNIILVLTILVLGVLATSELFDIVLYRMTTGSISISSTNTTLLSNITSTINDLAYPFSNVFFIPRINELYGLRWGMDYVIWLMDLLPSRLLSPVGIYIPDYDTLNVITSAFYKLIEPITKGGVPTDFLSFGLRQGKVLGLIFNTILYASMAMYVDGLSKKLGGKYFLFTLRVQLLFYTLIPNNDLTDIIRGNLFIVIIMIMLISISRNKNRV